MTNPWSLDIDRLKIGRLICYFFQSGRYGNIDIFLIHVDNIYTFRHINQTYRNHRHVVQPGQAV